MTDVTAGMAGGALIDLSGNRRRLRRERRRSRVFLAAGISSLIITAAIIFAIAGDAFTVITNVDLDRLWTDPHRWAPRVGQYDLLTIFAASFLVTGVAMIVAIPLGLGAAIYLSEYARPPVRKIVKPILEVLAGIPSIVLGFFAVAWLGPNIVQEIFAEADAFSVAAAGLGVGVLITPLVASVSEDAMRAVPNALREASYGMGAKKVTTVLRVVFPAAISGIVAAIILAASRAIGETMIVLLAAGAYGQAEYSANVADTGLTITAAMASLVAGTDAVASGAGGGSGQAVNSLYFLGILLFVFTLVLNVIGDRFVRRIRETY
jgi:phosphate transport system permease protein